MRILLDLLGIEIHLEPLPEQRFRALVRLAYAVLAVLGFLAAVWMLGRWALLILVPAFILALIATG